MTYRAELLQRIEVYCRAKGLLLGKQLGFGVHGMVFSAGKQPEGRSAIKVHEREADYRRERDIYLRLKENEVKYIRGCAVPELIAFDDELWIIEITLVTQPFILDFAGAYLDWSPDFSEEVMADWRADKQEQFGKQWPEVLAILARLESYGIYMEDVSPSNISLGP